MSRERYPYREPGPAQRPWIGPLTGAVLIIALLAALLVAARVLGTNLRQSFDDSGAEIAAGIVVTVRVDPGSSAQDIGDLLEEQGVVAAGDDFATRVEQRQLAAELKAGTFELETGMELDAAIDAIVAGSISEITVTVVEGLTLEETLAALARATGYSVEELRAPLLDGSVTSALLGEAPNEVAGWEGMLFPDTYSLGADDSPQAILQRLADTMVQRLAEVDWSRLEELGVDQYEAIVVASLVEEEVRIPEERAVVASVIYNRLAADMLLQIDATVQYALEERKPALSLEDLEVDSPYNTYREAGLPPTPIAGVGIASLEAAADPADTDFLFYVLTSRNGEHSFAETEAEFLEFKEQARRDGIIP